MKIISHICFVALCFSGMACVPVDSLNREVGVQAYGYQEELKSQQRKTRALEADRSRLQSRLSRAESKEAAITSDGVTPAEQAELAKVREEIRTLRRTLENMSKAG